ncbi:phospholipase [Corticibacter populi]|uniref:Phospholipase A1 n=1 Tax=Corticibacter populi TaxID=1550736 RepID=A0A3M6QZI0_9BURK|nr:phospholipase A [Corticibacter populi]RMX08355.1 phospholipase [Corticibacter populi]RZS35648.1 phospholipase A1 [Corticibacter populi]
MTLARFAFPPLMAAGSYGLSAFFCAPGIAQELTTQVNWQQCLQLSDDAGARLACYDQWAANQQWQAPTTADAASRQDAAAGSLAGTGDAGDARPLAAGHAQARGASDAPAHATTEVPIVIAGADGCRNPAFNQTSRHWELDSNTDCGNFRLRGYRPINLALATSDRVNQQPYSPGPLNGLAEWRDYQRTEARIQVSVRTKLASNILTQAHDSKRDSLWFGYTFQSYWQIFNHELSRPFRNTDHEPELVYVYPLEWKLPGGARLRYAGLGLSHQSNGQSNPLSRSWNRSYIMAGLDVTPDLSFTARLWHRLSEKAEDDDNPRISDYIGRAELGAIWDVSPANTLALTVRHSLRSQPRGSARLEWYHTLGSGFAGGKSNLRLHTSLFSGYGDSLLDYNYRRTVLTIGFSLLDF